ncbi:MmgE/PrpD family protein [Azospirillum picis]|uniref:2-methylcitrate dehydratase PrpD n=1 Tax=Azospirillum picis TaxID=488438 RepID=A0ABU0MNC7_9PROT|nr:MmgE/PrpD family protein [Azospirillum picis]MBP2300739.1 2-methylcitrate dehydratase PrpD [Azospirillum picis]MDQ0534708.1 2-methylcitrate dehydratase PrpD [Azospirillum picis]
MPPLSTAATPPPALRQIGAWIAGLRRADIPEPVATVVSGCIADTLGVALAGARASAGRLVAADARDTYADGPATLLAGGRLCPEGAAFANVAAAHALDFDDNCYAGFVHGSAVVVPAALAAVEAAGGSGSDLLTAVTAGTEAQYVLADAVGNGVYHAGWWTTALFGAVGAAAAAAKAGGLTEAATADALAFALCGTGGLRACFGTDAKPLLAAQAAAGGVRATRLAARGLEVPHGVIEDPRGFARLMAAGAFDGQVPATLGRYWRLLDPGIDTKAYPVCLSAHAALDAVRDLMAEERLSEADIATVRCRVPPVVAANLTYDRPVTPAEARFSLPFAVACAMRYGTLGLEHLDEAVLADPSLGAAMGRVAMAADPGWNDDPERARRAPEGAEVTVVTLRGDSFTRFCAMPRGSAARPLAAAEHAAKFRACAVLAADRVPGPAEADRLYGRLRSLDRLPTLDGLLTP